jgi:hypothetical protein
MDLVSKALKTSRLFSFIVSDILDFSQISMQKFSISATEFNIYNCVKDVAEIFDFSAEKKNIEL